MPSCLSDNSLVCEVLKVKHVIADSKVVYCAKSKNRTYFLQSVNFLKCGVLLELLTTPFSFIYYA